MRIASSLLPCLTHESWNSRPGRYRYRSFRCTPHSEREPTGVLTSDTADRRDHSPNARSSQQRKAKFAGGGVNQSADPGHVALSVGTVGALGAVK